MKTKLFTLLAVAGALALGGTVASAQTDTPTDPVVTDTTDTIQGLIAQFREQRQELLQARQQLMDQLRTCTEEERAQIIAQFREQYKEMLQDQVQLRKQIRQELMTLRRERRHAGDGSGNGSGNGNGG